MESDDAGSGDRYRIDTPERVDLEYDVASIGSRLLAAIVDTVILSVLYILLWVLGAIGLSQVAGAIGNLARLLGIGPGSDAFVYAVLAAVLLLDFAVFWGYYLIFELTWNGQSPGKRWVGLRVIREGGYPIGFTESAIRNLVRLVDFLPVSYAIGVLVMFVDRRSRRLGDLAAGTLVVKERRELRLSALGLDPLPVPAVSVVGEEMLPNLHRLTASDWTVLREYLLRRPSLSPDASDRLAAQLATAFSRKLEHDLAGEVPEQFLARLERQVGLAQQQDASSSPQDATPP